ncbi:hypothetical protein Tco_0506874, partial [Tanacetum coccineum]
MKHIQIFENLFKKSLALHGKIDSIDSLESSSDDLLLVSSDPNFTAACSAACGSSVKQDLLSI